MIDTDSQRRQLKTIDFTPGAAEIIQAADNGALQRLQQTAGQPATGKAANSSYRNPHTAVKRRFIHEEAISSKMTDSGLVIVQSGK
jgi:hypothetical protein